VKPFSETCQVFSYALDRVSLKPGRENPSLYRSVFERFPEWSEQIPELLQANADFDEICADYEELTGWLTAHSCDGATECVCIASRELLAELEEEIMQFLKAVDHQPGHQA
jgi:hypothetical protein